MAIIKCPECGNNISDKAKTCPNCGYPIETTNPNGSVRIKFSFVRSAGGVNGNQKVSLIADNQTLWKGQAGSVIDLTFTGPTEVTIIYHISLMHWGGQCTGIIDPNKSKKYNVSVRQGVFSTKLVLQPVDVFDSD